MTMYIMITSRCNMECPHCGFSCTADGEDMSFETFKKIIDEYYPEVVAIGGGEPTLHPRFWDMLMYAVGRCDQVWLATNGTQTEIALTLAKLAEKEIVGCELSLDEAHDISMVDPKVIEAFTKTKRIRNIFSRGRMPVAAGRALENYDKDDLRTDSCVCPGPLYRPNGDVLWCGCPNAPKIGTVDDGFDIPDDYHDCAECFTAYTEAQKEIIPDLWTCPG